MKSTRISQVNVEAGQASSLPSHNTRKPTATRAIRRMLMTAFFPLLLGPVAQLESKAQAPAPDYVQLNAVQLDQLVAPIALDPDPLVAQILTASTYPDQVGDADHWLSQKMNLAPDQRAAGANSMAWDPSVKGLIPFPAVLDSLAKNTSWTTQLGNAYFNQPGDVMDAIQAMRLQAFQAHVLVKTLQENVVVTAELIEIVPVDPAVVFVPYYNPWRVWSTVFAAYPGYVVLPPPAGLIVADGESFEPPVAVSVDAQFGWGFNDWSPAWGGGAVVFNHNTYISSSRTVINHGHFGRYNGGAFERAGRGVPAGFHPGAARDLGRRLPVSQPAERGYGRAGSGLADRAHLNRPIAPTQHPYSPNRASEHNPTVRSTANRGYASHPSLASNSAAHTRGAINGRSNYAHATTPIHSTPAGRSTATNRATAPSASQARFRDSSRTPGNSPGRTFAGRSSNGRSGNNFAANRPMNRPSPAGNSLGGNRPATRPTAGNPSLGGARAFNRPASLNRPSGGFGGAHVNRGGKR
jgi:Protein of unknown function (DUF3300)